MRPPLAPQAHRRQRLMDCASDRPIGPLSTPIPRSGRSASTLKGRWITLAPLDAERHAEELLRQARTARRRATASGPTSSSGRIATSARFAADIEIKARSVDPHVLRRHRQHARMGGWLSDADAYRPRQSRHRGRPRHVYAGDAAHRRRRPKRNICSRAMSSTASAIGATNGSATTSTRLRSARRSGSASPSRASSAST